MARAWDSTAVEGLGGGRYRGRIDDVWTLALVPQGGVVAALAARAMAAELGTDQPLRSLHLVFASPLAAGDVDLSARVLRRGRSVSQASVDLATPGSPVAASALGAFGGDRAGFEFTGLVAPEAPPPEGLRSFRDPPPPEAGIDDWPGPWPFWGELLDGRLALGHAWWDPSPREAAEIADWFRFEDPPVTDNGALEPYALLVMADMMPGAVFERIGPTDRRWFSPSVDLSVHLFGHATPGWILAHAKAHHAGDGYASAEMALWDPRAPAGPRLVAWACQQMFFTPIDG